MSIEATAKLYSVDEEWLRSQLEAGVCTLCRAASEYLVVDHDHSCCPTGSCGKCVRGVVCSPCNTRLGKVENGHRSTSITWLRQAEVYLGRSLDEANPGYANKLPLKKVKYLRVDKLGRVPLGLKYARPDSHFRMDFNDDGTFTLTPAGSLATTEGGA